MNWSNSSENFYRRTCAGKLTSILSSFIFGTGVVLFYSEL